MSLLNCRTHHLDHNRSHTTIPASFRLRPPALDAGKASKVRWISEIEDRESFGHCEELTPHVTKSNTQRISAYHHVDDFTSKAKGTGFPEQYDAPDTLHGEDLGRYRLW